MSFSRSAAGRRGFTEINVTPLVDVMLVLLVVFMVTAPLLSTALPVRLPQVAGGASSASPPTITVVVNGEGRVFIGKTDCSDDLKSALRSRIGDSQPSSTAIELRADRDARYADVARVVAVAKSLGVSALNLMVESASTP
jgi:biopolymer transport protein TolR